MLPGQALQCIAIFPRTHRQSASSFKALLLQAALTVPVQRTSYSSVLLSAFFFSSSTCFVSVQWVQCYSFCLFCLMSLSCLPLCPNPCGLFVCCGKPQSLMTYMGAVQRDAFREQYEARHLGRQAGSDEAAASSEHFEQTPQQLQVIATLKFRD